MNREIVTRLLSAVLTGTGPIRNNLSGGVLGIKEPSVVTARLVCSKYRALSAREGTE